MSPLASGGLVDALGDAPATSDRRIGLGFGRRCSLTKDRDKIALLRSASGSGSSPCGFHPRSCSWSACLRRRCSTYGELSSLLSVCSYSGSWSDWCGGSIAVRSSHSRSSLWLLGRGRTQDARPPRVDGSLFRPPAYRPRLVSRGRRSVGGYRPIRLAVFSHDTATLATLRRFLEWRPEPSQTSHVAVSPP